ncbi:MAG: hypothetical protein QXT79_08645 [Thermofilaceae archaeon]
MDEYANRGSMRGERKRIVREARYTKRMIFLLTPEEHELLFLVAEKGGYGSAADFLRTKIHEEYERLVRKGVIPTVETPTQREPEKPAAKRGRFEVAVDGVAEAVNDDFISGNPWIAVLQKRGVGVE